MAQYEVCLSKSAENDLAGIVRYISNQLNAPATAVKMVDEIEKAIINLAYMPKRCAPITDERLALKGYRKLQIKNYIAFFTIDESDMTVQIKRILYAARDWRNIL